MYAYLLLTIPMAPANITIGRKNAYDSYILYVYLYDGLLYLYRINN